LPGSSLNREWTALISVLAAVLAVGVVLLLWKLPSSTPIRIVLPSPTPVSGEVYVGGEVVSPGLYPWAPGLTVEQAITGAGGPTEAAEPGMARLTLPLRGARSPIQKININTAEPWLLQALDGIGPKLAGLIVAYRDEHGPFRLVEDLTRVPGIGAGTLANIRERIAVGE